MAVNNSRNVIGLALGLKKKSLAQEHHLIAVPGEQVSGISGAQLITCRKLQPMRPETSWAMGSHQQRCNLQIKEESGGSTAVHSVTPGTGLQVAWGLGSWSHEGL